MDEVCSEQEVFARNKEPDWEKEYPKKKIIGKILLNTKV
jgi:hypothetical protein